MMIQDCFALGNSRVSSKQSNWLTTYVSGCKILSSGVGMVYSNVGQIFIIFFKMISVGFYFYNGIEKLGRFFLYFFVIFFQR